MSWLSILVVVVLTAMAIVALVLTISTFIPRDHAVSVRARFARPTADVWQAITRIEEFTAWRPELKSVNRRSDVQGRPAWIEHSRHGAIPFEVIESDAPRRLVARIADDQGQLAFGGTWTWVLRDVPSGCELTITENGFIAKPLFRVLTHFAFGYSRTLEDYLRALGTKFGETTTPKVV